MAKRLSLTEVLDELDVVNDSDSGEEFVDSDSDPEYDVNNDDAESDSDSVYSDVHDDVGTTQGVPEVPNVQPMPRPDSPIEDNPADSEMDSDDEQDVVPNPAAPAVADVRAGGDGPRGEMRKLDILKISAHGYLLYHGIISHFRQDTNKFRVPIQEKQRKDIITIVQTVLFEKRIEFESIIVFL